MDRSTAHVSAAPLGALPDLDPAGHNFPDRPSEHFHGVSLPPEPIRFTERPWGASETLDTLSPARIARLFQKADDILFRAVSHESVIGQMTAVVESWRSDPPDRIVLGGAGSSGRIAYILARQYRSILSERGIELHPWIAGGVTALRRTMEGAEDDAEQARAEIAPLLGPRSFFIGISAGLSAPAVAAGLLAAHEAGARCAVLGNNPLDAASSRTAIGLPSDGMLGVVRELSKSEHFFPLSVVVGPEVLTGSSRLKAGSSAWVVLDALFQSMRSEGPPADMLRAVIAYHKSNRDAAPQDGGYCGRTVQHLIELATLTLRSGGKIFLAGDSVFGPVAFLDASEQPPTFGIPLDQIQGFIRGGWGTMIGDFASAAQVRDLEKRYPASVSSLISHADQLKANDLIIAVGMDLPKINTAARTVRIWPNDALVAKLMLNAVSTGAMAQIGKVFKNRMIDLVASNQKLVDRAVKIISTISGVEDLGRARKAYAEALTELHPAKPHFTSLESPELAPYAVPGSVITAVLILRGHDAAEAHKIIGEGRSLRQIA